MDGLTEFASTPQFAGICVGCTVFIATLASVGLLLVFGGTFERLRMEAESGPDPVAWKTRSENKPKIVDELLAKSKILPLRPAVFERSSRVLRNRGDGLEILVRNARASDDLVSIADGSPKFGDAAYDRRSVWPGDEYPDFTDADADGLLLSVVEATSLSAVGALRLTRNRPRDLAIGVDLVWMHPDFTEHVAHASRKAATSMALAETVSRLVEAGYRRIEARVDADDAHRRRCLGALGFAVDGILRKDKIVDDRSCDTAVFSVLNTDWRDSKPKLYQQLGLEQKPFEPPPLPSKVQ